MKIRALAAFAAAIAFMCFAQNVQAQWVPASEGHKISLKGTWVQIVELEKMTIEKEVAALKRCNTPLVDAATQKRYSYLKTLQAQKPITGDLDIRDGPGGRLYVFSRHGFPQVREDYTKKATITGTPNLMPQTLRGVGNVSNYQGGFFGELTGIAGYIDDTKGWLNDSNSWASDNARYQLHFINTQAGTLSAALSYPFSGRSLDFLYSGTFLRCGDLRQEIKPDSWSKP